VFLEAIMIGLIDATAIIAFRGAGAGIGDGVS